MRALVACGWFGIQAWIGGEALHTMFKTIIPGWPTLLGAGFAGHTTTEWLSFLLFWGLNIFIIYRGMDLLREVENWAAPFVLVMTGVLLWWAVVARQRPRPAAGAAGQVPHASASSCPVFVPSLTAMIGYWATLSLNMPDFTRFGRSQREQIVGQVVALPTTMSLFAAMGVMITSATAIIYGESIWDPVQLVGRFTSPVVVAVSMFTVVVATLAVNIAANVVSPANDFANAFPKYDQLQDRRPDHRPPRHRDSAVAAARGRVGLHLHVAARLLRRARIDRRRADRGLLDRAAARAAARGSVSRGRRVSRLELARDRGDGGRLRAGVGRARRAGAEAALRLRVVRRLLRVGGRRTASRRVARQRTTEVKAGPAKSRTHITFRLELDTTYIRHSIALNDRLHRQRPLGGL